MKLGSIRQGGNKDIIQGDWNGRECRPMSISFGSRTILCLLSLLLWSTIILPNGVCAQKLTAIVDNNHVAFGESFRLTVETSIHLTDDLDFSPLEKDFEILSTSKGSRVNYINGNLETSISWTLELSPKKTGTLTIPSLQGKDGSSDPITITVDKSTGGQSEISKEIFVEMDCDPKDPYVGQQVLCRLRLFYGPNLREGGLTNPEVRDAVVRQLGKDQTYQESRNGRSYSVSERRFALFFQTSGVEDIGVPVFTGRVLDARYGRRNSFGSFFEPFGGGGVTKRVRIEGKAQTINVQPRPAEMNDLNWLPAQELELHDQWSSDNTHMKKGDLISRTVIIDAKGLAGSQLPDPAPQEVAGFKVYADKAVESTTDDFNGVSGQRKQEIAFIADEVGVFSLPAITLKWWDTQHKVMREASLPARAMVISENEQQVAAVAEHETDNSAPPSEVEGDKPSVVQLGTNGGLPATASALTRELLIWKIAALSLGSLWLITICFLATRRIKAKKALGGSLENKSPDCRTRAKQARTLFHRACSESNAVSARKWLLDWASNHWMGERIKGLDDLALRMEDEATRQELATLNSFLYRHGEQEQWNGKQLASLLSKLPKSQNDKIISQGKLPPIYPNK